MSESFAAMSGRADPSEARIRRVIEAILADMTGPGLHRNGNGKLSVLLDPSGPQQFDQFGRIKTLVGEGQEVSAGSPRRIKARLDGDSLAFDKDGRIRAQPTTDQVRNASRSVPGKTATDAVDSLNVRAAGLSTQIGAIEALNSSQNSLIAGLGTAVTDAEADIAALQSSVAALAFLPLFATGVDGATVGDTTIATLSIAGKRFYPMQALIAATAGTVTLGAATLSIGTNSATFDNIMPATALSTILAQHNYVLVPLGVGSVSTVADTAVIKTRVSVAITTGTLTLRVGLLGWVV